jgi:hypothetical protein
MTSISPLEAVIPVGGLVEAWETYPKQTLRNHCEIGGPNGRQRLTVPVNRPNGNHTLTKDIRIASHSPWQKIHWRSFESAYNKSPFFLYYQDSLLPFFNKEFTFLLDLNMQLLETILIAIRCDKQISLTNTYEKSPANIKDLRDQLAVGSRQKAINPNPSPVSKQPEYYQVFADKNGFMEDLSILDLLFNLGPETLAYLNSSL